MTSTEIQYFEDTDIPLSDAREIIRVEILARDLILEYMNGGSAAVKAGEITALIEARVDDEEDPVWVLSVLAARLAQHCADALPTWADEWLRQENAGSAEFATLFLCDRASS